MPTLVLKAAITTAADDNCCYIFLNFRKNKHTHKISGDANHSKFRGIIPIFKVNFRITILDDKIPANNDFKMVPDKIKEVTSTCTRILLLGSSPGSLS